MDDSPGRVGMVGFLVYFVVVLCLALRKVLLELARTYSRFIDKCIFFKLAWKIRAELSDCAEHFIGDNDDKLLQKFIVHY